MSHRDTESCPSESVLAELLRGTVDESAAQQLSDHLVQCASCAKRYESLQASDPFCQSLREQSQLAAAAHRERSTELFRLMNRLEDMAAPVQSDEYLATDSTIDGAYADTAHETSHASVTDSNLANWPERIEHYRIQGILGEGGMSTVLQARDERLPRKVALKILREDRVHDPVYLSRFDQEGKSIAELDHPHIVRVLEIGKHGRRPYLALEFVAGGTLADYLRGNPVEPRLAARTAAELATALAYAHQNGVVHRDLKPANVLLKRNSLRNGSEVTPSSLRKADSSNVAAEVRQQEPLNEYQAKIADFGLAKRLNERGLTQTGDLLGTPSYMAPEQTTGADDLHKNETLADVYSLGAILYEMLTGRPPFIGATVADTFEQVRGNEPIAPKRFSRNIPKDLETICLKALAKEPQQRYSSAASFGQDLERFLGHQPIQARPASAILRLRKWTRRHPALAALLGISLVATVIVVSGSLIYERRLSTALAEARSNSQAAERSRVDAATAYQSARDTLEDMLGHIEDRSLASVPRLKELQRRQLEEALQFYEAISQRQSEDPRIQYDAARAAYDAGRLQEFMGRVSDARQNYEKAIDGSVALLDDNSDDALAAALIADARVAISGLHAAEHKYDAALDEAHAALALIEPFSRTFPQPAAVRHALTFVHHRLGSVYMIARGKRPGIDEEQDWQLAVEHTLAAHDLLAELVEEEPDNLGRRNSLAKVQINLSVMYQQRPEHFEESEVFHDLAEATLLGMLADSPEDIAVASDLVILTVNWAYMQELDGELDVAAIDLGNAIGVLEELIVNEPNFATARDALYRAHGVRAQVLDALGRFEESVVNWEGCVRYSSHENNHRLSLAYALVKSGDYQGGLEEAQPAINDPRFAEMAVHFWLAATIYGEASNLADADSTLDPAATSELVEDLVARTSEMLERAEPLATQQQWLDWQSQVESSSEFATFRSMAAAD